MKTKVLIKKLKALADPVRLKILYLLTVRPCCVCELSEIFGLTQPALTKHLQKLHDAGIISVEKFKNYQIYFLITEDEKTEKLVKDILSIPDEIEEEIRVMMEKIRNSPPMYPSTFLKDFNKKILTLS